MTYEVEQKFRAADVDSLVGKLELMGCEFAPAITQVDRYFAHPSRDFGETDEALRIRQVGDENRVTYKGPKIDAQTKTRREIELPLASGQSAAEEFGQLLMALGFKPVATVTKLRRTAELNFENRTFEIALDEVRQLGQFVELETPADEADLDSARESLAHLAEQLDLTDVERQSYLELLLDIE